ncbi:MAG: EutN/CcmL family microcompartment protein [Cyanobacteria bacterium NC_groundwater_1444_Ag_S-0.65um_54_12]|nr:EutN/CcmL family microcompartment protein [Cyanobacteria bacterium NC_groundwater_1444_Ag_S-0.65um_54_12]
MFVAEVIGTLVASVKDPALTGVKLLIVQPLDEAGKPAGSPLIATDMIGIGTGERAFCVLGREAALSLANPSAPVDAGIVGIVDRVDL